MKKEIKLKIKPKKDLKEYYCSKHGNNGRPECKECVKNLKRLAKDNNAIIIWDLKNGS